MREGFPKNEGGFFNVYQIPHYYGDGVRALFIIIASLMALAIPILGDVMPLGTAIQVSTIVALVILAGLTDPHSRKVFWFASALSVFGIIATESAAITYFRADGLSMFIVRELAVLFLILALYFSIKTLRAMYQGKIGHSIDLGEFDRPERG